ncbi:MAG: BatD family protein [Halieaceae bacterium]
MSPLGRVLALLCCLFCTELALAEISATIDRTRISVQDTLTLTLRANAGEDLDSIDLAPLQGEFAVGTPARTSRFSSINGRSERTTELRIALLPRRLGKLQVPAFRVAGQTTQPIEIVVEEASTEVDNSRDVFVEAELDADSVYVQSQLIHSFRIYEAVELQDRARSQLEVVDAVVEELDSNSFQRNINGRTYRVHEVQHAIFPQKSGELTIPSISFSGRERLARRGYLSFGNAGEAVRRRSQPLAVRVKPIPAAYPDAAWLPARALTLEEHWSTPPEQMEVGDSATRTLTLRAEGIDGKQLPAIEQIPIAGIKFYPDQARSENILSNSGITGIGISSAALLVTQAGKHRLPAIRIPWWDTGSDQLRFTEIPAREFTIAATLTPGSEQAAITSSTSALEPGQTSTQVQAVPSSIWLWTTIAALAGWLLTTLWLLRRSPAAQVAEQPSAASEREPLLFRTLLEACEQNRAGDARLALQRWGQRYFNAACLPTLTELQAQFSEPALNQALAELEQSLFGDGTGQWTGGALMEALRAWRKHHISLAEQPTAALPPLYD